MDIQKQTQYWLSGAAEDLEVARVLMSKRHVRHALFFAELAVEKTLKAAVVRASGEIPPRTHNLLKLAELAHIELDEEHGRLLARLQQYYLEGRYPEDWAMPPSFPKAQVTLTECKSAILWLKNRSNLS